MSAACYIVEVSLKVVISNFYLEKLIFYANYKAILFDFVEQYTNFILFRILLNLFTDFDFVVQCLIKYSKMFQVVSLLLFSIN